MGRLKLAVVGKTPYAGRLAECMQKNGPEYLEVSRCFDMEQLDEFLNGVQPDILLCEQEASLKKAVQGHTVKILLADTRDLEKDSRTEDVPVIFRYQQGEEILRQVFKVYGQISQKELVCWHKTEDLEMAAVYAPGGHEFQLPFSLSYAALSGQESKVLYLNLAEFSGMVPLLGDEEGETFSDLIYGIRQKKEKFQIFLQSVLHHAETFDYVQPPGNPRDLYEIQEEDLAGLLSLLSDQTEYKRIVWNCGTLNQLTGEVLKHCGKIFCVVKENAFGKYRKSEFARFLEKEEGKELCEKVRYVSLQAGNASFAQGTDLLSLLQTGEFAEQVRQLTQD